MKKINTIDDHRIKIIWALDRHYYDMCVIEQDTFDEPWGIKEFRKNKSSKKFCIVGENQGSIVAYVIYEKFTDYISILRIVVKAGFRRKSIGVQLLYRVFEQMNKKQHKYISVIIPDNNLEGQLFFQNVGFLATEIIGKQYLMQYYV